MKPYAEMTKEELAKEVQKLRAAYHHQQTLDMHFDMSRGKPSQEQLDLSMGLMDVLHSGVDLFC